MTKCNDSLIDITAREAAVDAYVGLLATPPTGDVETDIDVVLRAYLAALPGNSESRAAYNETNLAVAEVRQALIEAIGIYQGWEESAVKMVDECILPVIHQHQAVPPTGQPVDCREAFEQWAGIYPSPDRIVLGSNLHAQWLAWRSAWNAGSPERESSEPDLRQLCAGCQKQDCICYEEIEGEAP